MKIVCARCLEEIKQSEWYVIQYRGDVNNPYRRFVHAASSQCSYMGRKPLETGDTL